ncbi:non-ribosomal peptide synthetase [Plantactinospora sp. BC1]|uniref:non-ribosomal peptide synthetase n=1 Tax=Plantactinospora sp. BC1 TaxID=2108470 RepID=UPI000D15C24A|nr:non-ribosomal peptide synthetase [Plantactinospora sp. BC1]AVT28459.1 non-ribosomal peptide synthetase [Plantactinospora sp. BC1]
MSHQVMHDQRPASAAPVPASADIEPTLLVDELRGQGDGRASVQAPEDVPVELPAGVAARLHAVAAGAGTSPEAVYRAAWAVTLGELLGRAEVLFGVADERGEVRPTQVRLGPEATLDSLVRARADESRAPHGATAPLFDTVLAVDVETVPEGWPIVLRVSSGPATGVTIRLAAGSVGLAAAGRLGAVLARVLRDVAERPDRLLRRLDRLSEAEHRRLVVEMNDTAVEVPLDRCVHELFEEWAVRTPDATAIICGDEWTTYAGLNSAANRLAHHLRDRGVARGALVGILLPRNAEMVTAMLAIAKIGAAFTVLDPTFPPARLRLILSAARARAVLTTSGRSEWLGLSGGDPGTICLDTEAISAQPADDLRLPVRPDDLLWVMFTSGSTGQPKGVATPHRALVGSYLGQTYADFGPEEVFLQAAPPSWDASGLELWGALLHGARSVLLPTQEAEPAVIADEVTGRGVTMVRLSGSLFNFLVDEYPHTFKGVRVAFSAGEAASTPHVRKIMQLYPHLRVRHVYGPAENLGFTTWHAVRPEDLHLRTLPVGRPLANKGAYLLDRWLRPVPVGVVGEFYLTGVALAHGYLHQPGLTAERFVADPFGAPGERMYRSGDLGRITAEGLFEVVGRVDHQVKVRGYRVEPAEVQAAFAAAPGVAQVVVLPDVNGPGGTHLVAYVQGRDIDPGALRAEVARTLPDYMVPSVVIPLDEFPRTPNGKLDRQALPAPVYGADAGREPVTDAERTLCALFAEVLEVDRVGADVGFFELGGHSLLAARLISRIRTAFGTTISIRLLFEASTVAELAARLPEEISSLDRPPLLPSSRPETLGLSFAQRRMWFLRQLEGPSATYNIPQTITIDGPLDVDALRTAFADLLERHEILRTVYPDSEGDPHQVVLAVPEARLPFDVVDTSRADVQQRLAEAARQPFDLTTELPIRCTVLRVTADRHVVLVVPHHIASDGWSVRPLMRDLATAYTARALDRRPSWSPMPVQYADYVLWHDRLLGREESPESLVSAQLAFWRRTLAGAPEELVLPTDRSRPAVASHRGGMLVVDLPPALHARLLTVARRTGSTLFMVLHSALAALLTRLGAGTDLPIGSAVAGRTDEALTELVGFFVNTVVLRTDTAGNPTFRQLVDRVREVDVAAYSHQDVPFERVVEAVNPARSLGRHPIFQVMLLLQNNARADFSAPGLECTVRAMSAGNAKFDLFVAFFEQHDNGTPAGMTLEVEYAVDLFDRPTVQRMTDALVRVLDAVGREPDIPLDELPVLGPAEHELLRSWNDTAAPLPRTTLTAMFEAQARRSPDAPAVLGDDGILSYAELDRRANRLARHLIEHGAGPEDLVAITLSRSTRMLVALLAVLKSGAAYLPVEPGYPVERIAYMLGDAAPVAVIAESGTAGVLPPVCAGTRHIVLDAPGTVEAVAALAADDLTDAERRSRLTPQNAAYVIYTSGSTGRPKGVLVSHESAVNLARWAHEEFGPDRLAHVLFSTSLNFDVSVFEMFGPLLCGGAVEVLRDALALAERPPAADAPLGRPTLVSGVPSALAQLVATGSVQVSAPTVVLAGEALTGATAAAVQRAFSAVRVVNAYGPTEDTVYATSWASEGEVGGTTPIGRPIRNCQAYVLDGRLRPVPVGVVGELYLAGTGLARGYLGRFGLTAERFVANPYGAPGDRMYRTGDLVRWTGEGLVYLGRVDHQVKVRGFRIELGEIEAVLTRCPEVAQAVVTVRGDRPDDRRIVGYVRAAPGRAPAVEELRAHVAGTLPDYMVPSAFVVMDAFPLNANGKLDRAALPAPGHAVVGARGPRDAREELLTELFAEVLGMPRVGVDDDFFRLGGHSLLGARLIGRIRSALGVELGIRTLFEAPTVAGLARRIASSTAAGDRPALRAAARPEHLPLSFAQRRIWLLDAIDGPSAAYNLPLAFRLEGPLDTAALTASVGAVVARHESLRTVYREMHGEPEQVVLAPEEASVPVSLVATTETELDELLRDAAAHVFDLRHELPIRVTLFAVGPGRHVLLLLTHHIATDGWSERPLLHDLSVAYAAHLAGREPDWAPLAVQYADYTLWQRDLLGALEDPSSVLAEQAAFWRRTLHGVPEILPLPADRPRPAVASHVGDVVDIEIDAELHARLLGLAGAGRVTLFMVLHAGLATLLTRCGAGEDLPIGSVVAGRVDEELDDLVGFFVNTLVLRTDTSGDPRFTTLLDRVRETDLAAFGHHDIPFDRVVELVNPRRSLAHHPLFQVMLLLQNTADAALELPEVAVSRTGVTRRSAKFDMFYSFQERWAADGTPAGLHGTLEYATDLLDRDTAEGLAAAYMRVLHAAAEDPTRRLPALLPQPPRGPAGIPPSVDGAPCPAESSWSARSERIAELFAEALGVPHVGPGEDFFSLGGHSLLAVKLIAQVRAEFGAELSIRALFESPTPAALALRLGDRDRSGATPTGGDPLAVLLPLRAGTAPDALFCVHPVAGIAWVYAGLLRHLPPDLPVYGLQARRLSDPDAAPASLAAMAEDYLAEIRAARPRGPYHLLGWSFGAGVAHEIATRLQAEGEHVTLVMLDGYPARPGRAGALHPDDPENLRRLLASLGLDDGVGPAPAPADVLTAIRRPGGALADLPERAVPALARAFAENSALAGSVSGRIYRGDLVFFRAAADEAAGERDPGAWRPYVSGEIVVHDVASTHHRLLNVEALATIGPLLAEVVRT